MTDYKLGVLGNPVAHSRSPEIHQLFAEQAGLSLTYIKVLVPDGRFEPVAREFLETGTGFNITVPCKHEAWQFVDSASDSANLAEAVNTVSLEGDGTTRGDNTDGPGLVKDLVANLGWTIKGSRVLVLGAGGAVSGVMASLLSEEPALIHVFNRTHEKARLLEEKFSGVRAVSLELLEDGYDIVINGTSAGLTDQDLLIPGSVLTDASHCYDMIYGAGVTRFNAWCLQQADCAVADGLGMLVEQAALAFMIWFADEVESAPDTRAVIHSIRNTLD